MSTEFIIFLLVVLVLLIILSAFFSSSETAMMALNRYRMKHRAKEGDRAAKRVVNLLKSPERLLGVILAGNTFANILASAVATMIAVHYMKDVGALIASVVLTFVVLIFAEVAPKTVAASYADRWASIVSAPLYVLLKLLNPIVVLINAIASLFLKLFGYRKRSMAAADQLSHEELRSVVSESKGRIPAKYLSMLLATLDLQKLTINEVMVPRNEIYGIDLDCEWNEVLRQIKETQYTRVPVYRGHIDSVKGILHVRDAMHLLTEGRLKLDTLMHRLREPYFVPEGASLYTQMMNFQKTKRRAALVVDEYGDIQGMITLEDILEEIVGEFTTDIADEEEMAIIHGDGSYIVDGDENIRDLNREMKWSLPLKRAKTLSGLIIDVLQEIPEEALCVRIEGYRMEILEIRENIISKVKVTEKSKS